MDIIGLIVVLSLLLIFYAYLGYPLILWCLNEFKPSLPSANVVSEADAPKSVSIVITVHNEARVIREKLENTLAAAHAFEALGDDYSVEVIVASDGSTDDTDTIVSAFAERGVKLVSLPQASGKEYAQQAAVATVSGDIIVFTDAKVTLDEQAIVNVSRYFSDKSVGAVSSIDVVDGASSDGSGEGLYVRYEMKLRSLESRFNSLVGLSGSAFAVRRDVASEWRTDLPSDFAQLLRAQRMGLRGVHGADVVCRYKPVATEEEEFSRKVRTVLRGLTAFFSEISVLNPLEYRTFAWQIFSHKLCRWLVPPAFIIAFIGSYLLSLGSGFFFLCFLGLFGLSLAALVGYVHPHQRQNKGVKIALYFMIANMAILRAWVRYLSGERTVRWVPSEKGRL
ncbi:MAG: glycosyltransferase [bacterium]|nr:glycosyltransferase [bacterium]